MCDNGAFYELLMLVISSPRKPSDKGALSSLREQ